MKSLASLFSFYRKFCKSSSVTKRRSSEITTCSPKHPTTPPRHRSASPTHTRCSPHLGTYASLHTVHNSRQLFGEYPHPISLLLSPDTVKRSINHSYRWRPHEASLPLATLAHQSSLHFSKCQVPATFFLPSSHHMSITINVTNRCS